MRTAWLVVAAALAAPRAEAELLATIPVGSETTVRVYAHEHESCGKRVPLWSYVTSGMEANGQAEMVFSILRGADEKPSAFPEDPLRLFGAFASLAANGQIVQEGEFSAWDGTKQPFLGERRLTATLYARAVPLAGLVLPLGALAAVAVYDDELAVTKEFGNARVLARLGKAHGCAPYLAWHVRGRATTSNGDKSALSGSPLQQGVRLGILREENRLVLRIVEADHARLLSAMKRLGPDVLVLATRQDPTADAWLVWRGAAQKQGEAISLPGSRGKRISGNFVMFLKAEMAQKTLEDGFGLGFRPGRWQELRRALIDKQALRLPAEGDAPEIVVEWVKD